MLSRTKQEARRSHFKKGIDTTDARKKRGDMALSIRKNKREETLMKRRNMQQKAKQKPSVEQLVEQLRRIPELTVQLRSRDLAQRFSATQQFRKLLSIEKHPPIREVIEAGVVDDFVRGLRDPDAKLQFESAWALTNIASGTAEQTRIVIRHGAVPLFVELLASPSDEVREQAAWALGNIAGDSAECRDLVLQAGAMGPLLECINLTNQLNMLRNAIWTLSNFCRGRPAPPFELVRPALRTLARLLYSKDDEVLTDVCWALSYLSDGPDDRIQAVVEAGVSKRLVALLMHGTYAVQTPALRTVGNIVTGSDVQTQLMINAGCLPRLASLMTYPRKAVVKEACWAISNITAGTAAQIKEVLMTPTIVPQLLRCMQTAEWDVKKEAAWAIGNATNGTPEQVRFLVESGCIPPLCDVLLWPEPRLAMVGLEALENILRVGKKDAEQSAQSDLNPYHLVIESCGGVDNLEELQNHENQRISDKATHIIAEYLGGTENADLEGELADGAIPSFQASGPTTYL
eukprot:CAMPEP_0177648282 /NCGR_PEP_ID=MMETSP0447-20121125/10747_1 /TAXON_ID=0 /ORGANISM="Stygamoeba regulata, Strain BSH-02190019" /LENGTH=516 /DNA_ID=CAMNT_0019150917 /DNA_START=84 /DNA_END=1634 /DNA_ORIENTATION=+